MASATGQGSEGGVVWRLASGMARLLASVEGERWTESAGRHHVLARLGRVLACSGVFWASWARRVLVVARVSSIDGEYMHA
jgi:hypothetical protein